MSRFAPNRIQAPFVNSILIPFSFAPAGSGAPTIISGKGAVSGIVRTSTGLFTATLSSRFKAIVEGQVSLQLTTSPTVTAATYVWTDATDTDSVTFAAGASAPGVLGNNLKVVVATGSALATKVAYSAGITTVTFTIDTTVTTPALLATYVNTTAPNGLVTVSAYTGTTAFTVFLSAAALTGGSSNATIVPQIGTVTIPAANDATAETVQIRLVNTATGAVGDIASGAVVNVELMLLVS